MHTQHSKKEGHNLDEQQQPADAWDHAEERFQVGQEVQGIVTRVTQFGVFARVEPGLEGVIYAFELGIGPAALAGFTPGQELRLFVRNIDASRKRLELGVDNNPLPAFQDAHALPPTVRRKSASPEPAWPTLPPLPDFPQIPPGLPDFAPDLCRSCQRPVYADWKFCVYCGYALQRRCGACGSIQPDLPDARYCRECGKEVL